MMTTATWPSFEKSTLIGLKKHITSRFFVRLESREVGTELRNTLGGGKCRKAEMRKVRGSGNAESAGKRKCGRSGNAERAETRKAECDRIVGRWMNGRGVTERRTDGRTEGRTDGWKEGRVDGRKDGRMERRTDRRKDGQNALRRCERLGLSLCAVPSLNGTVCVFLFGGSGSRKGLRKGLRRQRTEGVRKDGINMERWSECGKTE